MSTTEQEATVAGEATAERPYGHMTIGQLIDTIEYQHCETDRLDEALIWEIVHRLAATEAGPSH
jgi:hypothetical protein